jgi:anti-sigma B factor antagonist
MSSEAPAFTVEATRPAEEQAVVTITGELDLMSAEKARPVVLEALHQPIVVLDLSGCTFCDSSGLRLILTAVHQAAKSGHEFRIAHVRPEVARSFALIGLDAVLHSYPDVATALVG